ncbi:MAG: pantoate--beta-alanine ligase, partial [Acidobacteria bacterium]|nr:pantoate--beta-alanine ligase [Acidobacteriota bacterium]
FRAALDAARAAGRTVGLVPTMGYLHEGHASLIRRARAECGAVAVTIFVNPLQFGPAEDLARYPRDLDRDLEICAREGADLVFHPPVEEMYSGDPEVTVSAGPIAGILEGASRPGHFDGVVTVVAKLFNIAGPCRAYFGEKDAQQLVVIRRLARALDFPVEVVGCPTVREPDGLAMSSRNVYLGVEERAAAKALKRGLDRAAKAVEGGERDGRRVAEGMARAVSSEVVARLDYAVCVDPETLAEAAEIAGPVLLAVAARFGSARLIDNVTATPPGARGPDAARGHGGAAIQGGR